MFKVDQEIFFQMPDEGAQRILHPGIVEDVEGGLMTASIVEKNFPVAQGLEFLAYFEQKRVFMKLAAQVQSFVETDEKTKSPATLSFTTSGEPVSAENRQCYRVSAVVSKRKITVASEEQCPLLDMSSTGFAFSSTEVYPIGKILDVGITYDSHAYQGRAAVQSIRTLPDGQTRYGMYCTDERSSDTSLSEGLHKLSMTVQREQLQRLAGTS